MQLPELWLKYLYWRLNNNNRNGIKRNFLEDLILNLESCIFSSGVPLTMNASGTQKVAAFESFSVSFERLEKYFDRYQELESVCKKMHEERNTKVV